ncbi:hypothetical protein GCM10022254_66470 [Actinomadura meridiana]|uniref:Uncharacterized protein n=1 Tax=Actinomadura meridiana TaxID=559626 RepID=A0ABP8CLS7_9ACTN
MSVLPAQPATPIPVDDPGGAAPAWGPRLRAAGSDPSGRAQEMDADTAAEATARRLHAMRRARRDARTRASRVRRVLLAPTPNETPNPRW